MQLLTSNNSFQTSPNDGLDTNYSGTLSSPVPMYSQHAILLNSKLTNIELLLARSGCVITINEIKDISHNQDHLSSNNDSANDPSAKHKIENLKNYVGFNISQLAHVLMVKRPAIYEWLDGKEPNRINQERLNTIFSLFRDFNNECKIDLRGFYYIKLKDGNSLFDLLTEQNIDTAKAAECIAEIKEQYLLLNKKKAEREKRLSDAGFKPASPERIMEIISRHLPKA